MTYKYSPSAGGFYVVGIHGASIPADAVEVQDDEHRRLMDGQSAGLKIVAGANGAPILVQPLSDEQRLESARSVAASLIDSERDRLRYAPILYGGVLFDADADSQALISGTVSRLVRGDGLPDPWVGWRDLENVQHWAADNAETVAGHLRGLSAAIENRQAAIRIASWQKKGEVQALQTVSAIQAYPVTEGWP